MKKNIKHIIILSSFLALLLWGCDAIDNSVTPTEEVIIKSLSKWNVDVETSVKNNLVLYQEFTQDGRLLISEAYFETGILSSSSQFSYDDNTGEEVTVIYDESGEEVKKEFCEYKYEDKKVITKKLLDSDGKVLKTLTYDYNSEGRVIKTTEINAQTGSEVSTQFNYQFNNSGNLVERVIIDNDGTVRRRDSLNYRGDINSIEIINFDLHGAVDVVKTYIYNYNGNVTTEIESNSSGKILRKFRYEYTYY